MKYVLNSGSETFGHLEERETGGKITLKCIFKEFGCEDGRLMYLARDRFQGQAVVLAMLNLWVRLIEN